MVCCHVCSLYCKYFIHFALPVLTISVTNFVYIFQALWGFLQVEDQYQPGRYGDYRTGLGMENGSRVYEKICIPIQYVFGQLYKWKFGVSGSFQEATRVWRCFNWLTCGGFMEAEWLSALLTWVTQFDFWLTPVLGRKWCGWIFK